MFFVLCLCGLVWMVGHQTKTPPQKRWYVIAGLFAVAILVNLTLPETHGLRKLTGGTAAGYIGLIVCAAVFWVYRALLRKLREKSHPVEIAPKAAGTFSTVELDRYARHIVMREIGGLGQKKLKEAKVLVVGAGGLGSPILLYLAAAGVGTIGVIDDDTVDNSNLQRQVIHSDATIGMPKVFSAQAALEAQNPHVTVRPYHRKLTEDIAPDLFKDYDIVIDGTDNFDTRYLVNRTAVTAGIPLISGALTQWEGQLSVFDPARSAPCYECVFPTTPDPALAPSCAAAGVVGPLPGVVGTMIAVETIKVITGAGAALRGEMLIYDALYAETRKIAVKPRGDCAVCGGGSDVA